MSEDVSWREELIQAGNDVYIMRWALDPDYYDCYVYRVKFSNGQTLEMMVFASLDGIKSWEDYNDISLKLWFVDLFIATKKKRGYEFLKRTGKLGITTLLVAKEILKWHIDHVINSYHGRKCDHVIMISWDDKSRERVYERGLRDLGFVIQDNCSINKKNVGKGLVRFFKNLR